MDSQIEITSNAYKVAQEAIIKAYSLGIGYNDLNAIRVGKTRSEAILPHSIVGDNEKEDACRDVVEAVIDVVASQIPDTPTPLIEPEGSVELRMVPRQGWNCCSVMSSTYNYNLEYLLACYETGSAEEAYERAYRRV
jgi:hypothetical protein